MLVGCEVRIGDCTLFGPAVQVYTATHPLNAELRRLQEFGKRVEIGSDVWVGGGAIICPGVRIGSRCVIGAGSVVTRDIPEGSSAAGNPCRVIRELDGVGSGRMGGSVQPSLCKRDADRGAAADRSSLIMFARDQQVMCGSSGR